jgi:hypothetical protein
MGGARIEAFAQIIHATRNRFRGRFVIWAAFHPGILVALVRHAAQQMDTFHSAIVGNVLAGFSWVVDYLVTPLMMLSSKIAPRQAALWMGHLLSWSTSPFARPLYGTFAQVDAEGQCGDQPAHFRHLETIHWRGN